jgi:hypothetical protein
VTLDTFILGDNAFFGVNHHSRKVGAEKARFFENTDNIIQVLKIARREGAGGVMLSSHVRTPEIIRAMRREPDLGDFNVYPNIPYIMKYVQQVTQVGMTGTLRRVIANSGWSAMFTGGVGFMKKDFKKMLGAAIDLEMVMYKGVRTPAIFLHNGLVDLALGLGMHEVFRLFDRHIRERYHSVPGYGTLNLPLLSKFLHEAGLENPLILAPFNSAGFHMNPSRELCEKSLAQYPVRLLAMNVLASGSTDAESAFRYLSGFKQIGHVVVGATQPAHIQQSYELSKKYVTL